MKRNRQDKTGSFVDIREREREQKRKQAKTEIKYMDMSLMLALVASWLPVFVMWRAYTGCEALNLGVMLLSTSCPVLILLVFGFGRYIASKWYKRI